MTNRRKQISRHRLRILNQEALTRVLTVLERRKGSQKKAGATLGLSQGSFSRLKRGERKYISYATYFRIVEVLGGDVREFGQAPRPVLEFIANPSDREIELHRRHERKAELKDHDEAERDLRAKREAEALQDANLFAALESCVMTDDESFAWGHWEFWMQRQLELLEPWAAPILEELWTNADYRPYLQKFLEDVGRAPDRLPPDNDLRCRLALYRAVAPLGDAERTWGIERSWKEMHQLDELGPYLKAALSCEELLLRPRRDLERVKRAKPPESFANWLGRMEIEDDLDGE